MTVKLFKHLNSVLIRILNVPWVMCNKNRWHSVGRTDGKRWESSEKWSKMKGWLTMIVTIQSQTIRFLLFLMTINYYYSRRILPAWTSNINDNLFAGISSLSLKQCSVHRSSPYSEHIGQRHTFWCRSLPLFGIYTAWYSTTMSRYKSGFLANSILSFTVHTNDSR